MKEIGWASRVPCVREVNAYKMFMNVKKRNDFEDET